MSAGYGSRSALDVLSPWKILSALSKWIVVLMLLPKHFSSIDRGYFTLFTTNNPAISSSSAPYFSSLVMIVEAENVVNPTDQFDINSSYLRVTIRHQTFHEISSCQHRITQLELHNLVTYIYACVCFLFIFAI